MLRLPGVVGHLGKALLGKIALLKTAARHVLSNICTYLYVDLFENQ